MLTKGVVDKSELSHISYTNGKYQPQFHLTLMRAANRPIDGGPIFREFGDYKLGTVQVSKVQISSRLELADETQRMKRELWD